MWIEVFEAGVVEVTRECEAVFAEQLLMTSSGA